MFEDWFLAAKQKSEIRGCANRKLFYIIFEWVILVFSFRNYWAEREKLISEKERKINDIKFLYNFTPSKWEVGNEVIEEWELFYENKINSLILINIIPRILAISIIVFYYSTINPYLAKIGLIDIRIKILGGFEDPMVGSKFLGILCLCYFILFAFSRRRVFRG